MRFSISDSMVSEFMSGLFAVFALIAVGAALMLILTPLRNKFPFTRIALTLALTPFSLIRFMEHPATSTLFLYSTIAILLGITIDGINHILTAPKREAKPEEPVRAQVAPPAPISRPEPKEQEVPAPEPGMMVWERAE